MGGKSSMLSGQAQHGFFSIISLSTAASDSCPLGPPLRGPPALASTGSVATDLPSRGHEGTAVVPGQQHLLPETQSRSVQPMVLKIDSDAELEELRMMLSSGPPSRRATPSSRQGATKEEMRAHDGAVLSPSKKIQVRL